jgi:acyl carrier protein
MDSIKHVIANVLNIPDTRLSAESSMRDTPEWDSLKHIELILELERHYGIALTGDEIAEMTSVQAIMDILQQKGV